jgi:hypothetical protein
MEGKDNHNEEKANPMKMIMDAMQERFPGEPT